MAAGRVSLSHDMRAAVAEALDFYLLYTRDNFGSCDPDPELEEQQSLIRTALARIRPSDQGIPAQPFDPRFDALDGSDATS